MGLFVPVVHEGEQQGSFVFGIVASEKFADSALREAIFVIVRGRIANDLSRGEEILEPVRYLNKQRER